MSSRIRQARSRATELTIGLLLVAMAAWLSRAAAQPAAPPEPAAQRTPVAGAPPARIGPRYDDDGALPERATPVTDYTLSARLDPTTHEIAGSGSVVFRNTSAAPLGALYVHLYLNAFKNERTLFLRSPFVTARDGRGPSDFGYIDVRRLAARELGGRDIWPGSAAHSPGDPDDQTDIQVPLPTPLEPGQSLTLDVEFTAKLPSVVARTGYAGSFHFVAQWFPKLARLESDGTFAHFPFHPQSEFHADFGRYDVTIDVPEGFVVGATGARTESAIEAGRHRVRHVADSVHDFAWTAWDRFQRAERQLDGIAVSVLYPPGHEANARTTLEVTAAALPILARRYGPYPYPSLTIVHPPAAAVDAGGMEYPTLITTGGPWYSQLLPGKGVELVTVHELGHQWFQGMVASNEHAFPFLDEGLTTHVEQSVMEELYGRASLGRWFDHPVSGRAMRRAYAASAAHDDVIAKPADQFASWMGLFGSVYSRTATLFDTLSSVYGKDEVERALGRYARYYRFAHPGPRHLILALQEVLGEEAAEQASLVLFEGGWVDYRVDAPESVLVREPRGVFERSAGRATVDRSGEPQGERHESRVVVRRHGTVRFPVTVELVFAGGRRERRTWDGRGSWTALSVVDRHPVVGAIVDPELRITLDQNLGNNATARGVMLAPRTLERTSYVAALLFGALAP